MAQEEILIIQRMRGATEYCSGDEATCREARYGGGKKKCCTQIDLNRYPARTIWLVNELYLNQEDIPRFDAVFRPKFYRCDTAKFRTSYSVMTLDDLKKIAKTFKKFDLEFVGVRNAGEEVTLEEILEALQGVEEFTFNFRKNPAFPVTLSRNTFKNIRELDNNNLGNLKLFELEGLPEMLGLDELVLFMQEHKDTKFYLNFYFPDGIPQGFKTKVDAFIDAVIATNVPYRLITYRGQDNEKLEIMKSHCKNCFDKKFY